MVPDLSIRLLLHPAMCFLSLFLQDSGSFIQLLAILSRVYMLIAGTKGYIISIIQIDWHFAIVLRENLSKHYCKSSIIEMLVEIEREMLLFNDKACR